MITIDQALRSERQTVGDVLFVRRMDVVLVANVNGCRHPGARKRKRKALGLPQF